VVQTGKEKKEGDDTHLWALKPQRCRQALDMQEATLPHQAATGGRGHAWKTEEDHRRQAGGGALLLKLILKYLRKCH
jgi:hypothetical protein